MQIPLLGMVAHHIMTVAILPLVKAATRYLTSIYSTINLCNLYLLEGFISPKIFIYFFINSDSKLTQTQMLRLAYSKTISKSNPSPSPNLNPNLNL